ncbi:MAG: 4-hydroxy-3-methylbut-2-enyl diphosphate reductase [Thomasclavelia sp.]|nr:4-hydroxy-3-methylbut-2-enyl diphosphate reductase [Thomasclavelia sp.]
MKVTSIVPRGYCKGVVRAINIAKDSINDYPQPIYILGMIVHNQYVVDGLTNLGIITLNDTSGTRVKLLDSIDKGTVIITAHGSSQEVKDKALSKGLKVIDATCLDVIKTHDLIKDYLNKDYEILYVGKESHPEAVGAISINKDKIHLIQSKEDIDKIDKTKKYILTNQTTMSLYDIYPIYEYAKTILDNLELMDEVCNATRTRQKAIDSLDNSIDLVYIVGDPHSNNSMKLASIASKHVKLVKMITSVEDININDLKDKTNIGISSGASTPTYLTNQVIDYLKQLDINNKDTYKKPKVDINKII